MRQMKYFDHKNDRPLDPTRDGCALADWEQLYGKAPFAIHPFGFPVFLSPKEIHTSDEYATADPYTVEQNINNEFHNRRITVTLALVKQALGMTHAMPKILDLGCGQGHITGIIRNELPDAEISDLDYSLSAIEYAQKHFHNIDFAVGNALESPYANNYFDLVICNNLWEHVPDPLALLRVIDSMLKYNGFLIISTPSRYRFSNLVRVIRGKSTVLLSKYHVTEYTVGQVVEQLQYGGFKTLKVTSKPLKTHKILTALIQGLLSMWIALVGSRHQLESTVFFLAQKSADITGSNKEATGVAT